MNIHSRILAAILFCLLLWPEWAQPQLIADNKIRVMAWNIWRGGRQDGEDVGPKRVIEVIRDSEADIVAMQETYGSGEIISKGLGFHFQERGTNVSIHSRFPIVEDISVFEEFKCTGALIQVSKKQQIAFYSIWLPFKGDIWLPGSRDKLETRDWLAVCQPSANDIEKITAEIQQRLSDEKYKDVTIMLAGDFNSMSHLDYGQASIDQFKRPVNWPTSIHMAKQDFRDAYRETNPVIDRKKDSTWSPRFPEQEKDRIDFVYYKSKSLRAVDSSVIQTHKVKYPSDHGAVVATFENKSEAIGAKDTELNVISYNIKRGYGMDNKTDITRAGALLNKYQPDFVGLQEIDINAQRSGKKNQMVELGKQLDMHYAFGKFMDFQGGEYGMGILSRHPICSVEHVQLPKGNEPRVALAVTARLPNDQLVLVVNVHFDWVKDDRYRFAQAQAVKNYLDQQSIPYILLGDFNDQPKSRTVKLFSEHLIEAKKPIGSSGTFPSNNPKVEIDYIFVSPGKPWQILETRVISAPVTSDHAPVFSRTKLKR